MYTDQPRTEDGACIDNAEANVDAHPLINELKFYNPASATAPVAVETGGLLNVAFKKIAVDFDFIACFN